MNPNALISLMASLAVALPTTQHERASISIVRGRDGTTEFDPDFFLKTKRDGTTEFDPDFFLKTKRDGTTEFDPDFFLKE